MTQSLATSPSPCQPLHSIDKPIVSPCQVEKYTPRPVRSVSHLTVLSSAALRPRPGGGVKLHFKTEKHLPEKADGCGWMQLCLHILPFFEEKKIHIFRQPKQAKMKADDVGVGFIFFNSQNKAGGGRRGSVAGQRAPWLWRPSFHSLSLVKR